jgi:purine-nucleoside phosphorylase
MTVKEQLESCIEFVRRRVDFQPEIALVLGSGLGAFAEQLTDTQVLRYSDIPGFPVSTVAGHAGQFVFGTLNGAKVAVMQGRVHMYEGYTAQEAVLPIRLLHALGAKILFLTNAAGGIQAGMKAGEFMLITDQISSFVPSPLRGENIDTLGVRFPDMSEIYSKRLQKIIRKVAVNADIPLKEGVYLQTAGPAYESPAEIRMFRLLGADAVGMSTAIEAIAARHMGMEICGVSCISNLAAGISPHPLTHEEVKEAGDKAAPQFAELVRQSVAAMHNA